MRPLRVLHGPLEVAGVAGAIVDGLRKRGHDAELVVMNAPPFGMPADRVVDGYPSRLLEGLTAPLRHDVLHFHFNVTFCEGLDAAWARVAGRPLILMHFHGDDCRRREVTFAYHTARARIFDASHRNERLTLRRLRTASRFSDAAIVGDFELLDHIAPFFRLIYLLPLPVKMPTPTDRLAAAIDTDALIVLHAPSDPVIKGTETIRQAFTNIAARRPLTPRIVTGVSRDTVLRDISQAHLVVDQLNAESLSIFGLQSMALGKPVLSEFRREMLHPAARKAPVVRVTPDTVEQRIEELLDAPQERERLGREGPPFVKDVHASDRVAAAVEMIYEHAHRKPTGVFTADAKGIAALPQTTAAAHA